MAVDYPSRIDIPAWGSWNAGAGTLNRTPVNSRFDAGSMHLDGVIGNNWAEWKVLLKAGTWAVTTIHATGSNYGGTLTVTLGAATLGTLAQYAVSANQNVVTSFSGIVVPTAGVYVFRIAKTGQDPGSPAVWATFSHATLQRTGA